MVIRFFVFYRTRVNYVNKNHSNDFIWYSELQPIEICWGVVKNHIARNCDFTMKNLIKQLDTGFEKVTAETCSKIIAKIRKVEDEFWSDDLQFDSQEIG